MLSDLRSVLRSLTRARGYFVSVVLMLGLGIGCTAAIFSAVATTLFPGRGLADPESLVRVEIVLARLNFPQPVPLLRYRAYEQVSTLSEVAGCRFSMQNLVVGNEPRGVSVAAVTANFFALLRQPPALGRLFQPGDDAPGGEAIVVLTYGMWRDRFGADPDIVGRDIRLNEQPHRVIGVLPEHYRPPMFNSASVYVPVHLPAEADPTAFFDHSLTVLARLAPGSSLEQAQAELRTMRPEEGTVAARWLENSHVVVRPVTDPPPISYFRRQKVMNATALAAVALLYTIAAVNAANLMLVRAVGRRRELSIRLALGGNRWSLARPLLVEGLVVGLCSIAVAVVVARWAFPALLALVPGSDSYMSRSAELSWSMLAALAGVGLATGLVIAAVPAWRASQLDANSALKEGGGAAGESRRLRWLRGGLVVTEAALAVVLLTGTGLMIRTFQRMHEGHPGYDPTNRYLVFLSVPRDPANPSKPEERYAVFTAVLERLRAVPGVADVSLAQGVSPNDDREPQSFRLSSQPEAGELKAEIIAASETFFETLGVPLKAGRWFRAGPSGPTAEVVVNDAFARRFFPEGSPLGEIIEPSGRQRWEIVGVVSDVRGRRAQARPQIFHPPLARGATNLQILIRTNAPAGEGFERAIRQAVYEVNPLVPVTNIMALDRLLETEVWLEQYTLVILQVLAALALLLAVSGLFATVAYTVIVRRAEFGIRFALGASAESIHGLVIRRGVALTLLGVAIGLVAAAGLGRFMSVLLYETGTFDLLSASCVALLMLAVAVAACWIPARRAAKVDIARLLRSE